MYVSKHLMGQRLKFRISNQTPLIGPVHFSYNRRSFSACFFRRNSIFLSQQISRNSCRCFGPGVLYQLVNLNCVPLIPDGDAKRHKVYTGSGNRCPTSSLRDRSCIPCTEVLVVGGYKHSERGSGSQVSARCRVGGLRRCSQAAGMRMCVCYQVFFFCLLEMVLAAPFYSCKEGAGNT